MAIRSTLFTLVAVSLTLAGCRSGTPKGTPVPGARPDIGVPLPSQVDAKAPAAALPLEQPKKVAVILGPGGAKAFAHVGVLKALQQQRVPIEKIVGLEWGALIGALYAQKGTTHDLEWKLYKLEQQNVMESKGFFSRGAADGRSLSVMDDFLKDSFGNEEVGRAKVPFECPSRSIWSGVVAWQSRGSFRDALKRCLPFPPTFKAQGTFMAGPSQATEAVEALVKDGYNVIVLVNVLGSAAPVGQDALRDNLNYVILWQEIRRAVSETSRLNIDTVTVDTSAYPMNQFAAKKELILLGENAGRKAAADLISKYRF